VILKKVIAVTVVGSLSLVGRAGAPLKAPNCTMKILNSYRYLVLGLPLKSIGLSGRSPKGSQNPQAFRTTINLDRWKFGLSDALTPQEARKFIINPVTISHTWNAQDIQNGGKYKIGAGWYERSINVTSPDLKEKQLFLKFDAVSSVANVYVNDKFLGEHKGGFSAFCFDATPLLHPGTNVIDVRADNTPRPDVIPINEDLFAIFGGMYRKAELIETPRVCISPIDWGSPGIFVTDEHVTSKEADLSIKVDLQNFTSRYQTTIVTATMRSANGVGISASARSRFEIPSGPISPRVVSLMIKNPKLWQGRVNPYLYTLDIQVQSANSMDLVQQRIGLRSFSIKPGQGFCLNGRRYRLYGVCRHQDRQDEGNAVTDDQQIGDARTIYDIGATAVRLAHYQQSDVIYSAFDRNGVIVWAESPFVNASSGKESENAMQQYKELILQNYNHPSIAFWGSSNEVYGKTKESYVPSLIRDLALEGHELDTTRFTYATSGKGDPNAPEDGYADVQGINRYYGWYYGHVNDLETWFEHMKQSRPGLAYALMEYGAEANINQQSEVVPDKVDAEGQFFPERLQTALHIKSWNIIKKHPECIASFVWNMFDFTVPGWNRGGVNSRNMKGLITYDRKKKKDAYYWYQANWSRLPVMHIVGRRVINHTLRDTAIEIFSNLGPPQVTLNGELLPKPHMANSLYDWKIEGVHLKPGKNDIVARSVSGSKAMIDHVEWMYIGD